MSFFTTLKEAAEQIVTAKFEMDEKFEATDLKIESKDSVSTASFTVGEDAYSIDFKFNNETEEYKPSTLNLLSKTEEKSEDGEESETDKSESPDGDDKEETVKEEAKSEEATEVEESDAKSEEEEVSEEKATSDNEDVSKNQCAADKSELEVMESRMMKYVDTKAVEILAQVEAMVSAKTFASPSTVYKGNAHLDNISKFIN